MLTFTQPIDKFIVKGYASKIGHSYKIYYNKKLVARSYVYYHNPDDCYKQMWADIEMLKNTPEEYYDNLA